MPLWNGLAGGSSTTTVTGGGTNGTLATQGLYTRPQPSNEGLNAGTRSVANGLAYNRSVQPEGLVENRLTNLLSRNSPYIRQAEQAGIRFANSRGMLNSSMAAGAARGEAIRAGLPIASQDASAINTAEGQNVDVLNSNLQQERALMNEATLAHASRQSASDAYRAGEQEAMRDRQWQTQMQRERYGFEGEQRGLDRAHEFGMTGFEYGLRDQFADNDAYREEWRSNNDFGREFNGNMATMLMGARIRSTSDLTNLFAQYALDNPDVFSPDDYSNAFSFMGGMTDDVFNSMFADFFGGGY